MTTSGASVRDTRSQRRVFRIRAALVNHDAEALAPPFDLSAFPARDCRRPALAACPETSQIAFAYDARGESGTRHIHAGLMRRVDPPRMTWFPITTHPASNIAPALAFSHDRRHLWIGWHSNRKGTDEWDIPRWFHLVAHDLASGRRSAPTSPPRDRDLTPGWKHRWDRDKTLGRLLWVEAIRTVYQSEQELLGISAPKRTIREENNQEGGSAET